MEQGQHSGAQEREFSIELAEVIALPIRTGTENSTENVDHGSVVAIPVSPTLFAQVRSGCIIRTLVNAVQTDAAPFPIVALTIGNEGVFAVLEPGSAETAAVLEAAALRGWLPVMLHSGDRAVLVRVDWPTDMDELPGLLSSTAPLTPVQFANGLVSSLSAAPAAFERLPASERGLGLDPLSRTGWDLILKC